MVRGGNASPSLHQNSQPISPRRYSASSWTLSRTILAASSTSTPIPSPGNQAILYFAIKPVSAPNETALRLSRQEWAGSRLVNHGAFHLALGWLWGRIAVALRSQSLGYQHALGWLCCGFGWLAPQNAVISAFYFLFSAFASWWLCPAFRCWKLEVGCWMFSVLHKPPEYNSPLAPPSGWSGGTLVPPWYFLYP